MFPFHVDIYIHMIFENKADRVLLENLVLKRFEDKLVVVSDESDPKKQRAETFRYKDKLKAAGFAWNSYINSWVLPVSKFEQAKQALAKINNSPVERFIQKVEEIPEMVRGADNVSKKDELVAKIEGYVDQLANAVSEEAATEAIQNYLTFNAKFRGYSFHNTMLIWIQKPDATKVAGFKQWEEKFHRRVKKGAKGISILAPIRTKAAEPEAPKAGATPVPTAGGGGDEPDQSDGQKGRTFMRFMAVYVFDISDTEAIDASGEVPASPEWHASNEPNQRADEVSSAAEELFTDIGGKLTTDPSKGGEQGWARGDHINITSTIAGVNKAATTVHEIAHTLLHFKKSSPFFVGDIEGEDRPDPTATPTDQNKQKTVLTRELAELQAESVSFVVMKYYDFPVKHQATYLAIWKANKDTIRDNLTIIKKCSDFIISEMDKILAEKQKTSTPAQSLFECLDSNKFRLRKILT
jgi:hypothetical protein